MAFKPTVHLWEGFSTFNNDLLDEYSDKNDEFRDVTEGLRVYAFSAALVSIFTHAESASASSARVAPSRLSRVAKPRNATPS